MNKLKVVTVVGTRPELIRLSRLIPLLDELFDHCLVHTGQNSDPNLRDVFFRDLELREPDYYLDSDTSSFSRLMADTLVGCERIFKDFKPDAVTILGDTNSAVAAIVAERMGIPVYHMEAGNRSFDANVPEELNRKMIDHVATFNLPYNSYSQRNLLAEGIQSRFISQTGSPMREVLSHYNSRIEGSDVLRELGLLPGGYILASLHRQENVDSGTRLAQLFNGLEALGEEFKVPVLLSVHPRTAARIESNRIIPKGDFRLMKPFGFLSYCKLQKESILVVSDSGTVSEESAILGFPAITPRDSMERPEALEVGSIVMTGLNAREMVLGARRSIGLARTASKLPEGYEVEDFSRRVAGFILSTAHLARKWKGLHRVA